MVFSVEKKLKKGIHTTSPNHLHLYSGKLLNVNAITCYRRNRYQDQWNKPPESEEGSIIGMKCGDIMLLDSV
ncbi:MAG TPA: hypothetical protein DEO70_14150 [Bacteroidales bacterium]|nr:MAG: hypothetical protein A2X11_13525 [Bacteroidetes bacterium GWE2_42_24]OFY26712.1 MAG: hypothetical protein A2X09_09905 [Bacteroidetes bacterium GWF2_43_11]PKP23924.1 MAG: hypothetical protein CVU06_05840 [Bacteroidetes bacterium HGW-Bacteroidetes-22]HBZ67972.1 hypothetical protein [Bacteroidales bacterium]